MATIINEVTRDETIALIGYSGHEVSYLIEGHMGSGKSALLTDLGAMFPEHQLCYFDCTTKVDQGDLMMPRLTAGDVAEAENGVMPVRFAINEEVGLHIDKPIILMVDEAGKNPSLMPALTRLLHERKVGNYSLPEGSIVFLTTNIGGEGLGDMFDAHQCNRITTLRMKKPSMEQWSEHAVQKGFHPSVIAFVQEFPQVFDSYEEHENPNNNPYIFHPGDAARHRFVTGRSLEKTSNIMHGYDRAEGRIGHTALRAAIAGTLGDRAALDMMAFVSLADSLPKFKEILAEPDTAKVPDNITAVCMTVYNAIGRVEREQVTAWMTYLDRLPREAQKMFVNNILNDKVTPEHKQAGYFTNKKFRTWIDANRHILAADKK